MCKLGGLLTRFLDLSDDKPVVLLSDSLGEDVAGVHEVLIVDVEGGELELGHAANLLEL